VSSVQLTWTAAETDITEIASYSIFRNVDAGEYTLLINCPVLRDMFGGIIGVQGCTTTASPDDDTGQVAEKFIEDAPITYVDATVASGHAYCYYVTAYPMGNVAYGGSGPPSPPSNVQCFTIENACAQHLIQAAAGASFPGSSGVTSFIGWFGTNDGVAGPGVVGSTVSGQGVFLPGGTYGYADAPSAVRVPTGNPCFVVYSPSSSGRFAFDTVTINGHTYSTSSVPYFDNAGGCGPTYWIWTDQPAGLVDGQQYCVQWTLGT
jgi:hypothetical protein